MHDRQTQDRNVKFYPRLTRLVDVANKKCINRPSTNFTSSFSIFDALYDLESFNNMPAAAAVKDQQQSQNCVMSQEQFRDALLTKMLQVEEIE